MKIPHSGLTLLVAIASLLPASAVCQEYRLLMLGPRVGAVIDSSESHEYNLFPKVTHFHSASFYQRPDSSFVVVWTRKSGPTKLADSTSALSYGEMCQYAEWIEYYEDIKRGRHFLGSIEPRILYEDGTPLRSQVMVKRVIAPLFRPDPDDLLLALETRGFRRPIFHTIHLTVSMGLCFVDLSDLSTVRINQPPVLTPITGYIDIPLSEDPSVSVLAGASLFPQTGFNAFSIYILVRPRTAWPLDPIVGLGGGRSQFVVDDKVSVKAQQSYVSLLLGVNVWVNVLDAVLTIPFSPKLHTIFEGKEYSISITGPQLSLLLSL